MCLFGNRGFGGDSWIWVLIIIFLVMGCGQDTANNCGCGCDNGCGNSCDPCC